MANCKQRGHATLNSCLQATRRQKKLVASSFCWLFLLPIEYQCFIDPCLIVVQNLGHEIPTFTQWYYEIMCVNNRFYKNNLLM